MRFRGRERVSTDVKNWMYGARVGGITGSGVAAAGGTESTIDVSGVAYRLHVFNDSGVLQLLPGVKSIVDVEYLVIAGGAGGRTGLSANYEGAGGGAGGYRSSVIGESSGGGASAEARITISTLTSVTVGGPGAADTSGNDSVFGSITSKGGGRGERPSSAAETGGSGGGSWTAGQQGSGTSGQGYNGSAGNGANAAGGGGGAGAVGGGVSPSVGGNGGSGVASSITGSSVTRAGGGGGASNTPGSGGAGGGGVGGTNLGAGPGTGSVNTGGGGGGGQSTGSVAGASGGSGVVIIRYKI